MTFRFGKYRWVTQREMAFEYALVLDDGREETFTEKLELPEGNKSDNLDIILQNLSLVLGISYYKIYAPENVEFTYPLSAAQLEFWNTVYRKGLGEFWYRNQLTPYALSARFQPTEILPPNSGPGVSEFDRLRSPLVPDEIGDSRLKASDALLLGIGGGKDSIVAAEMLKAEGVEVTAFVVETTASGGTPPKAVAQITDDVVEALELPMLKVKRTLDEKLFKNWEGGYNGHVPISAVYAWLGVLLAERLGMRWVAVGNEYSSNFGNLEYSGEEINHQWSKAAEFESLMQNYLREHVPTQVSYFSVLRPFYELRVAQELAQPKVWEKYKNVFCSCNRAFRIRSGSFAHKASARSASGWCGECPKCAFVFAMLAAFLPPEEVAGVFGKNLFDDEQLLPIYRDLLGWGDLKPFDCVGTFEETRAALWRAREAYANTKVVKALAGKITDGEKLWQQLTRAQPAETVPHRFRFTGRRNALILGYGREGEATERFLKRQYPNLEIGIADQAEDPNYLEQQKNYDIAIKTPGIPKSKMMIQYTTATNMFFARVKGLTIGITGSKGKSTTASLIAAILQEAGNAVILAGNIGRPMLAELGKADTYVLELSSAQLDDIAFSPNIAVVTNLFPEHMDYHGSEEAYYEAKRNIIKRQTPGDVFVYDAEHPLLKRWASEAKGKAVPFAELLPLPDEQIPLAGAHNRKNIAAAVAAARELKIADDVIAKAIREFKGLPHRLEFVGEFKGIRFYDDAISTAPESTIAAIQAIPKIGTIFLGGTDRGYDFAEFAEVIKKAGIKNAVLFPDSGARMKPLLDDLNLLETDSMEKAVRFAYENTEPGQAVLLSCASPSYSLWKNFEEKGEQFRAAIRKSS